VGGGTHTLSGPEEHVTVTLLPEKEGMFMFQHHNYQVSSPRRGSKVVRRYSDFVWLLDCLHRKYPFRRLPLLPPKRVGGEFLLFCSIPLVVTMGAYPCIFLSLSSFDENSKAIWIDGIG
jgi:hypothetical protein